MRPPNLLSLPDDVLGRMLRLDGTLKTMLAAERTCATLRQALRNDKIWESTLRRPERAGIDDSIPSYNEDPRFHGYRDLSCSLRVLDHIRETQRCADGAFLMAVGDRGWTQLVTVLFHRFIGRHWLQRNESLYDFKFDFAFDLPTTASIVLRELVEERMVTILRNSMLFAVESNIDPENVYPVIDENDVLLVYSILSGSAERKMTSTWSTRHAIALEMQTELEPHLSDIETFVDEESRDCIVRYLSWKAGIVKLTASAYRVSWKIIVNEIFSLLKPTCISQIEKKLKPNSDRIASIDVFTAWALRKKRKVDREETPTFVPSTECPMQETKWFVQIAPAAAEMATGQRRVYF